MGCTNSKVYDTIQRQESHLVAAARYLSRRWQIIPTENEAKSAYSEEGTLTLSSNSLQVELRTLLDYPIAVQFLTDFIESTTPAAQIALDGWLDIQKYNNMPVQYSIDMKRQLALGIYEKYIRNFMTQEQINSDENRIDLNDLSTCTPVFNAAQVGYFNRLHDEVFVLFRKRDEYKKMNITLRQKYNNVLCSDFEYFDVLGEGGFGMVCEVRKKSTGVHYAMKLQRKEKMFEMFGDEPWRADFEKKAFASCKHPFIVELFFAFQTKSLAILVMTLGTGEDLSKVLLKCGALSPEHVLFYSAEITSALCYLHHKGFVYRDLKPGNVLLNADGHIQLVDFGAVCDLNGKTLGVCQDVASQAAVLTQQLSTRGRILPLSEIWTHTHQSQVDSTLVTNSVGGSYANSLSACAAAGDIDAASFQPLLAQAKAQAYVQAETAGHSHGQSQSQSQQSQNHTLAHSHNNNNHGQIRRDGSSRQRARSLIGTLGYMAPEMVMLLLHQEESTESIGYTKAVDWWSLGVSMYKLLTGEYPFDTQFKEPGNEANTEMIVQVGLARYAALFAEVDYSGLEKYPATVDCISSLLAPEEHVRLGYGDDGSLNVSRHPYFQSINWVELECKATVPPPLPAAPLVLLPIENSRQRKPFLQKQAEPQSPPQSPPQTAEKLRRQPVYVSMEHLLSKAGKVDWLKIASRGAAGPDHLLAREIQTHFECWDYACTAAVAAELEVQKSCSTEDV